MTKDIRKGCILVPLFHHVRFSQQKRFGTVCLRYCLRDWEEKGLDVADFRGCGFENTSFAGAVLTNAVFPAQSVPFLDIDAQRKHDAAVQAHDEILESLKRECIGECTACFPANAAWEKGHEKVTINGEQVLLRRCTMRCNYGGRITILLSGQPE